MGTTTSPTPQRAIREAAAVKVSLSARGAITEQGREVKASVSASV
jgi:hypothetical protein